MDRETLASDAIAATAGRRQRLTYGQLAKRIGGTARGMHYVLDAVGDRSMTEHGFRLDALVQRHRQNSGRSKPNRWHTRRFAMAQRIS